MAKTHLKTWTFYILMIALFAAFTYILFNKADSLQSHKAVVEHINRPEGADNYQLFKVSILNNIAEPAAMLLLQIISILII